MWRNWQTRHVQDVVGDGSWGFKSLHRHLKKLPLGTLAGAFFIS